MNTPNNFNNLDTNSRVDYCEKLCKKYTEEYFKFRGIKNYEFTSKFCSVDCLYIDNTTSKKPEKVALEIKCRYIKPCYYFNRNYSSFLLKSAKLYNMMKYVSNYNKEYTIKIDKVEYLNIVFPTGTDIQTEHFKDFKFFNTIDITKNYEKFISPFGFEKISFSQKVTQVDNDSPIKNLPTYVIPTYNNFKIDLIHHSNNIYKNVDLSEYDMFYRDVFTTGVLGKKKEFAEYLDFYK